MSELVKWLISVGLLGVSIIFIALAFIKLIQVGIANSLNAVHKMEHGGTESEYLNSVADKNFLPAIVYFLLCNISLGLTAWAVISFYG